MSREIAAPTKLLWMDLEFTDFDYSKSLLLEVSVLVTDFEFTVLGRYEARVRNDMTKLVQGFERNNFYKEDPTAIKNRNEFIKHNDEGKPKKQIEDELVALVEEHFGSEPAILAGNSIHSDRAMVKANWPRLELLLHYRMLDVSSFKILMQGKYGIFYEKADVHRATDDIQASIDELKDYLDTLRAADVPQTL